MQLHGGFNGHSVVNRGPSHSVQLTHSFISGTVMRLQGGCNGNFVVNSLSSLDSVQLTHSCISGTAMRLHGGCNGHFVVNRSFPIMLS